MKKIEAMWDEALGLQKVDNLFPSEYMISLIAKNIEGLIDYNEIENYLMNIIIPMMVKNL